MTDYIIKEVVMEQPISPQRKKHAVLRIILISAAAFLIAITVLTVSTYFPVSIAVRIAFMNGPAVAPDNYENIKPRVSATKNLTYPSKFKDNQADIYIPKDKEGPFPVVLWIHGGAFVGGDKRDVEIYATMLASEGIAVAAINYRRAPEAKYPVPVVQTGEAYLWLREIAETYQIDITRLVLAGDSAGAHVAAQFAAVQSNERYAVEMSMEQIVPLKELKAALLFCGPFNISKIVEIDSSAVSFLMERAAWAYFGTKGWAGKFSAQATITDHITPSFPPAFVSDGNTLSFEEHGRELADTLQKNNVPVERCFFSADAEVTKHEYQFVMNTPAGRESFSRTLAFIQKYA